MRTRCNELRATNAALPHETLCLARVQSSYCTLSLYLVSIITATRYQATSSVPRVCRLGAKAAYGLAKKHLTQSLSVPNRLHNVG